MTIPFRALLVLATAILAGCSPKAPESSAPTPLEAALSSHESLAKTPADATPPADDMPEWDPAAATSSEYLFELESSIQLEGPPKATVTGETEINYVRRRYKNQVEMLLHAIREKATQNGQTVSSGNVGRWRLEGFYQGEQILETYETANPELQTHLRTCFDNPLYRMVVDEHGAVTKERRLVDGPASEGFAAGGVIANMRLFHPPFYADKSTWQSKRAFGMGEGNRIASGLLTYEVTRKNDPLVEFRVSGTLAGQTQSRPGVKHKATYTVRGTQTYDTRQKQWISGSFNLDIALIISAHGDETSGQGTMMLTMSLVSTEVPEASSDEPKTQPPEKKQRKAPADPQP